MGHEKMDYVVLLSFIFIILYLFYLNFDYFLKVLIIAELLFITLVSFFYVMYDCVVLYFSVYFLILGVCEGVVGLSSLSVLLGWYGSDKVFFRDMIF